MLVSLNSRSESQTYPSEVGPVSLIGVGRSTFGIRLRSPWGPNSAVLGVGTAGRGGGAAFRGVSGRMINGTAAEEALARDANGVLPDGRLCAGTLGFA